MTHAHQARRSTSHPASVGSAGGHDTSRSTTATHDASREARTDASRLPRAARDASDLVERACAWCEGPIPARARRDAVCCSVRCRQARHRFTRTVGRARGGAGSVDYGRPLRLAYADPPYPGNAHLYRGHPHFGGEVDHAALIDRLAAYDGWALSTSAAALPTVLALCPPGVRVAAWHRGERPTASRWPLNAWEPVIYAGGRPLEPAHVDLQQDRRVDSLVHGVAPMTTLPGRVIGAKPAAFSRWLFHLLGAAPGDVFDDLFPGSGAITRAWHAYTTSTPTVAQDLRDASLVARVDASRSAGETRRLPSVDARHGSNAAMEGLG